MNHFPACFVELPAEVEGRRAAFYLAAEEWIAQNLSEDNYLFTWQVNPTVVMGRNQIAHQEVDIDFCKKQGIDIIRRRSGGGAIFADQGNIMISLITGAGKVEPLFANYAATIASGLRSLGAEVEVHGRNDIILAGKGKVCGNAFYHLANRNIVHGTMLYTTNPILMQGALKPAPEKLKAKGVQSVRSRVGILSDAGLQLYDVKALRKELRKILTNRSITLDTPTIQEIERIEQGYYNEDYLFGSSAKDEAIFRGRIEGCGTVELHLELKGSLIRKVQMKGDFFEVDDVQQVFQKTLEGIPYTSECIIEAIQEKHPEQSIRNLHTEDLINLIRT